MKRFVLASANKHKIKEFKEMFQGYEIISLADIGFDQDIEETGLTFVENARIKATAIHEFLKKSGIEASVVADDSGLCIEALNGEPGVFSARYAGGHGNVDANRQKVFDKMKGEKNRNAYFECVLVQINPDGSELVAEGKTFGKITEKLIGSSGFAFDPLFFSDELGKTFGEATEEEKNSVSHRARAVAKLKELNMKV